MAIAADPVDDRTFNGSFDGGGVAKLKEIVKEKLKEYMGNYTDDTLVEYVIVLLRNGRKKEEAKNELKIFLGDDSESFVVWLWGHLDVYFTSKVEKNTAKSSVVSDQKQDDKVKVIPLLMDSELDKGRSDRVRRSRQWRSQPSNVFEIPPLLSSEVHRVHNDEEFDHKQTKRPPSPQSPSHRERSRTDNSRNDQREAKPDVSRRLLQFAVRDALATSKQSNCSTEPSLKRLRSVVSTSTQESCDPEPATKIRSVPKVVTPMVTVVKAVAVAAEDARKPKSGRSVFDRIGQSTGFSETLDQHMEIDEVSPDNEERKSFSEIQEPAQHRYTRGLDDNGAFLEKRVNHPKSLQHRLADDPNRVKGMKYQNQRTEIVTEPMNASFSGNVDTGKTVRLEEQMKVPDVALQRYMDGGRLVSSEAIKQSSSKKMLSGTIGNGHVKPTVSLKEDSTTNKSVPASTSRTLEDASSRTIFVANVHFGATKDSLSRHFNKCGEVLKAVIVTDPATGQPSGSAYIEFTRKEAAENALALNGTSFMSRILKIVKGSNGQQQEAAMTSTAWSRGGRFTRASSFQRGSPFRGRSVVRAGARRLQWKRDAAETGNNVVAPNSRSLTYVRTEQKPEGTAT